MTPFNHAIAFYGSGLAFSAALLAHTATGYVSITPSYIALARPVRRGATLDELLDPWKTFPEPDAWFVYFVAGSLREALRLLPYPLPWVMFERPSCIENTKLLQDARRLVCVPIATLRRRGCVPLRNSTNGLKTESAAANASAAQERAVERATYG